jgi:hypothetical protein
MVEGGHHPEQAGFWPLRRFGDVGASRRDRVGEIEEVITLDRVQPQRAGKGIKDFAGYVALPALLESAVVLGANAGEHGKLVAAQAGHSTSTGEGPDACLRGSDPVAASSEELAQLRAISWHGSTVRAGALPWVVLP